MSATEELRRLLDEHGVEWDYGITGSTTTRFSVNGIDLTFTPMRDGLVCSTILTPEQAIAATLGSCSDSCNCTNGERTGERIDLDAPTLGVTDATGARQEDAGTCHDKGNIERFICSECGCRLDLQDDDWEATMWLDGAAMVPNYCPNCGRRIEVDDD